MSRDGEFWKTVRKQAKSVNPNPVQVGWIKSLEPLTVQYQGLELSTVNGDTLYINNLLLDAPIEFTPAEAITCSHGTITERGYRARVSCRIPARLSHEEGREYRRYGPRDRV